MNECHSAMFSFQSFYTTMEDTGVKVYKPKTTKQELLPCLIFLHGGGWTLGSAGEICVISDPNVWVRKIIPSVKWSTLQCD